MRKNKAELDTDSIIRDESKRANSQMKGALASPLKLVSRNIKA